MRRLASKSAAVPRLQIETKAPLWTVAFFLWAAWLGSPVIGSASTSSHSACRVQATTSDGWSAEELSNDFVRLWFVPRLGGRLVQVEFSGHSYLFVNPKYKGQYFPPEEKPGKWYNYGGDKPWPLPKGHGDDQHWPGPISDVLDDGDYKFTVISENQSCKVLLEGSADPATGLEFSRQITIGDDSPAIAFRSIMKDACGHPICWSIQSVTQYDTADARDPAKYNADFWALAPHQPTERLCGRLSRPRGTRR